MPKQRQIPRLFPQTLAGGIVVWHWKPSKKLRGQGFTNVKLGTDKRAATLRAMELNDEADAIDKGQSAGLPASPAPVRHLSFRQVAALYFASPVFLNLKPKSRSEYRSRLNTLVEWGSNTPIRQIDSDIVNDLRNTLVAQDRPYRTAALLRVLGLFMEWAKTQRHIAANPAHRIKIPTPPKRKRRLLRDEVATLAAAATDPAILGAAGIADAMPHVAAAVTLGFYTVQREADLIAATAFKLERLRDISPHARKVLAGSDGHVIGLVLEQAKTDTPVAIPLLPLARAAVESVVRAARDGTVASTHLIPYGKAPKVGACPEWRLQRDFRAVVNALVAWLDASGQAELAHRFAAIQFRDLRRSGMCWLRDLGVGVAQIAAISGHSIEYTQKILDTYMPRDSHAAAEGMALALTRQNERDAEDAQEGQG